MFEANEARAQAGARILREVLERLRASEAELKRQGIVHLDAFGSVARGEAPVISDVDLAAEPDPDGPAMGCARLDLRDTLCGILRRPVDLVWYPIRSEDLSAEIERDQIRAY